MNITIGMQDDYKLESDELNIKLSEKYEKTKDGEPTGEIGYKFVGYYRNLEHTFRAIIDRRIRASDAENLAELVKIIYDVKHDIKAAASQMEEALKNAKKD